MNYKTDISFQNYSLDSWIEKQEYNPEAPDF